MPNEENSGARLNRFDTRRLVHSWNPSSREKILKRLKDAGLPTKI